MLDAREQDLTGSPPRGTAREFTRQNVWKRIAIVAAGPLANFLLAIRADGRAVCYGMQSRRTRLRACRPKSAAFRPACAAATLVTAVNGEPVAHLVGSALELVAAAIEKRPADLTSATGAGRRQYRAVAPAGRMAGLESDGDLLASSACRCGARGRRSKVLPGGAAARARSAPGDLVTSHRRQAVLDGIAFIEAVRGRPARRCSGRAARRGQNLCCPSRRNAIRSRAEAMVKLMIAQAPEMVTVDAGPLEALRQGRAENLGDQCVDPQDDRQDDHRRGLAEEYDRADHHRRLRRADRALGRSAFLEFIAFISISLGVMNLLPIPVLDGGPFAVLFAGSFDRATLVRAVRRDRAACRDGHADHADGACRLQRHGAAALTPTP